MSRKGATLSAKLRRIEEGRSDHRTGERHQPSHVHREAARRAKKRWLKRTLASGYFYRQNTNRGLQFLDLIQEGNLSA